MGQVLELACGTGLWTELLVKSADEITAVDASNEVIQINRERVQSPKVKYIQADLFNWQPAQQYDVIFFSFWLSHVPSEKFELFWQMVGNSLKADGRVFFIDSLYTHISTAKDHQLPGEESTVVTRRLNDGREFDIVKIFYQPEQLRTYLADLGWKITMQPTENFFLVGFGELAHA
jgi:demethylmenaquinone methyltransferase/2-methoxy-6-polyprenyl-1,4-benzoquinol methylase